MPLPAVWHPEPCWGVELWSRCVVALGRHHVPEQRNCHPQSWWLLLPLLLERHFSHLNSTEKMRDKFIYFREVTNSWWSQKVFTTWKLETLQLPQLHFVKCIIRECCGFNKPLLLIINNNNASKYPCFLKSVSEIPFIVGEEWRCLHSTIFHKNGPLSPFLMYTKWCFVM